MQLLNFILFLVLAALIFNGPLIWKKVWPLLEMGIAFVTLKLEAKAFSRDNRTAADVFEKAVAANPDKTLLVFQGESYTYAEVDKRANKVARWAQSVGLKPNDVIALMMENRPEFMIFVAGLTKAGCSVSLINTNLTGKPLSHSLGICNSTTFIIGAECASQVATIRNDLPSDTKIFSTSDAWTNKPAHPAFLYCDDEIENQSDDAFPKSARAALSSNDVLFYIYTSGTTGLPKAAKIRHSRFYLAGVSFALFNRITSDDRIYTALPLYHSAAGMIGICMTWYRGATMVLRRKFSASNFFKDCTENDVTVIQYIGQLCRYLLNTPPSAYDTQHKVAKAIGNGMSKDIWVKFTERFNVGYVGEFYAATEGNCNLINNQNRVGAVGYIPPIASFIYPVKIVKFDVETETPVRGPDGLCIPCKAGETGELIGKIVDNDPLRKFDGYTNKSATAKKVLENAFSQGDKWFRTGDLLSMDSDGFMYFIDRIGDTFRWKGENVATSEVEEVINDFGDLDEINVYGVTVPGYGGRAGMASFVVKNDIPEYDWNHAAIERVFDLKAFHNHIAGSLASYQRPVFLRFTREMVITSTFKHRKADMLKQGFDPSQVTDPLFILDGKQKTYIPFTTVEHDAVQAQSLRL